MSRIQHTVTFRLNDGVDQDEFIAKAKNLAALPGVEDFEVLAQVSKKAEQFTLALSMWFDTDQHYDAYNNHPTHVDFVQNVWIPNVAQFIELDYLPL